MESRAGTRNGMATYPTPYPQLGRCAQAFLPISLSHEHGRVLAPIVTFFTWCDGRVGVVVTGKERGACLRTQRMLRNAMRC